MTETNERILGEFDLKFPCIQPNCDNHGTLTVGNNETGPEPEQCQYCDQERFPFRNFLSFALDEKDREAEKTLYKIMELIHDDATAISYQTMGQYRSMLIKEIDTAIQKIRGK